jgi:hypothetical protein
MVSKVFYSWQSDLPNATNRGFIEKALEDAAKSIREDESIKVEPVLDRDTVGVPGAPDIASTIFEKIEQAEVFVCDVSIISQSAPRPTPNPNVLLELGYAVKTLGWGRIIMVLNSAYGGPELLPFDLRMRRVLPYHMPGDAEERAPERRKLQGMLAKGLHTIFDGLGDQMPGELIQPAAQSEAVSVLTFLSSPDDEFESYVVRLLSNNSEAEFNIMIEKLRDATVSVWELNREALGNGATQQILKIKEEEFLPAMRKLTLLGLLLIKFNAPRQWFDKIGDLLEEIFSASHSLSRIVPEATRDLRAQTLDEQASHGVPAMESLLVAYLLGGYELSKRKSTTYTAALFPRIVDFVSDPFSNSSKCFFLFWPIDDKYWQPNRQRDLLVLDRFGKDERIRSIVGDDEVIKGAVLQLDCLVDWHSFMSDKRIKETETVKFFDETFPQVATWFIPNYTHESFPRYIGPLINRLWQAIQTKENNFWILDGRLAKVIGGLDLERRQRLLARFLIYAEREQKQYMHSRGRFSYDVFWPEEIRKLVETVRALDQPQ